MIVKIHYGKDFEKAIDCKSYYIQPIPSCSDEAKRHIVISFDDQPVTVILDPQTMKAFGRVLMYVMEKGQTVDKYTWTQESLDEKL